MIGIYKDDGTRLAIDYNSLTLNSPSDPKDDTYEVNSVVTKTVIDSASDPRPQGDGFEVMDPQKLAKVIRLDGIVRAPTLAKLFDKIELLAKKFDPVLVTRDNPTTGGFIPIYFDVPTTDTVTYASGLIACQYFARPKAAVEPPDSMYTGTSAPFTIELFCKDPRRYYQGTSTLTGSGTASNTRADYPSMPYLELAMAGAGSATYTATNSTVGESIVLDLSGRTNGQTVYVYHDTRRIFVGTTETPSLFVSGDFWQMKEGNNTITHSNTTNITTAKVKWQSAFSL